LKEGMDMLSRILQTRIKLLGDNHIATGEVKYTVGLLLLFLGDKQSANQYVNEASIIYKEKLGDGHPSTIDVVGVAESIENDLMGGGQQDMLPTDMVQGGPPMGIVSGGVEGMEGFDSLINQFPEDMPRATTQSPIPMPPSRQRGVEGDDSMRMTPSGSTGRVN
jgi:hypothetical protein